MDSKRMDERELEPNGFHVVTEDEEWGEPNTWGEEMQWQGEESGPVFPCRTIEVTDEIRQADAKQRAEREAARRASITWVSPVAALIAESRQKEARNGELAGSGAAGGDTAVTLTTVERGEARANFEEKRPAVYLFPVNRKNRAKEVA